MGSGWVWRPSLALAVAMLWLACDGALASAAVTPGWLCVPTTAGSTEYVTSGGTGSAPSCGNLTTAVLAPTYVASGVGGKPTVQFAAVNVQILNGAGSTATANGAGNLVLGYDEAPGTQTGSHDLVMGEAQSYTAWGELVGGYGNTVTGSWAAAFGTANKVNGSLSLVAGSNNTLTGSRSSLIGGYGNTVSSGYSALLGGCSNAIGTTTAAVSSVCTNTTTYNHDFAALSGGLGNLASGQAASVSGGQFNLASASGASVTGGYGNTASKSWASVTGGAGNSAAALQASVGGGQLNIAADQLSFIGAGCENVTGTATASTDTCTTPGGEALLGGANVTLTGTDTHSP